MFVHLSNFFFRNPKNRKKRENLIKISSDTMVDLFSANFGSDRELWWVKFIAVNLGNYF